VFEFVNIKTAEGTSSSQQILFVHYNYTASFAPFCIQEVCQQEG